MPLAISSILTPISGERESYWDNVKGILIILVLVGHFIMAQPQMNGVWNAIYFFHMPAFIFVSGYFSIRSVLRTEKILKLILLFVCFNFILMVGAAGIHPSGWAWGQVHLSAWYLLALILYRLSVPILEKTDIKLCLAISMATASVNFFL